MKIPFLKLIGLVLFASLVAAPSASAGQGALTVYLSPPPTGSNSTSAAVSGSAKPEAAVAATIASGSTASSIGPILFRLPHPVSTFLLPWSANSPSSRIDFCHGALCSSFNTHDVLAFLNNAGGTITTVNGNKYSTSPYLNSSTSSTGNNQGINIAFAVTGTTIDQLRFYDFPTAASFDRENHAAIFSGKLVFIPQTDVKVESLALEAGVARPKFSEPSGKYASAQKVMINTATPGASIRYTTDGTTPTETAGTLYTASITVSSSEKILAVAYKAGMIDSPVATAIFKIGGNASHAQLGGTTNVQASGPAPSPNPQTPKAASRNANSSLLGD